MSPVEERLRTNLVPEMLATDIAGTYVRGPCRLVVIFAVYIAVYIAVTYELYDMLL